MDFTEIANGTPWDASQLEQVIDSWKGKAGKGVPLRQYSVDDSSQYAGAFENVDATNGLHFRAGPAGLLLATKAGVRFSPDGATLNLIPAARALAETLTGPKTIGDRLLWSQVATPGAPGAGLSSLYFKSDGLAYTQNGASATERLVGGLVPLAASTLGSSAGNIDIINIPQTYRALEVWIYARGDKAAEKAELWCRFNGDVGTNYDSANLQNLDNNINAGTTRQVLGVVPTASATSGRFGAYRFTIPLYATIVGNRVLVGSGGCATNVTNYVVSSFASWRNTANAITQVTFLPDAGNFIAGSGLELFGIP